MLVGRNQLYLLAGRGFECDIISQICIGDVEREVKSIK